MFSLHLAIFSIICLNGLSSGSKILIVNSFYGGSKLLTLHSVAESLAERGHQIEIIKWKDRHDYPVNNHVNITVTTLAMDNSDGEWTFLTKGKHAAFKYPHDYDQLILTQGILSSIFTLKTMSHELEMLQLLQYQCETLLANEKLFRRLQKEKYDIAILDLVSNECGLALIHQMQIPVIGFWVSSFSSLQPDQTTAFLPASHIPISVSQVGQEMNFLERTFNVIVKMNVNIAMSVVFYITNRSVQKYHPGTPHPSDLYKNINGMLINNDPVLEYPRLLPPTFINVGGMQIRPVKPLPAEIENWMESSGKHGVILLAMGMAHDLSLARKDVVDSFMEAFSLFPQKFLVKFEGVIDHVPSNVKILKWIPQQDVLGHRKTKAYITHCGAHGVLEAAYHAVPMICMPLSFDHNDVFFRARERGIALGLNKDTVTTQDIHHQLNEVINTSKYKNNADKISKIMRDVKETPRERAIEFIEYMIRQKGAGHLKLASRHLNLIQYYSLDSLAFLLVIDLMLIYIIYKSIKFSSRILIPSNSRKAKKTN